jgi:predicted ribosomally synthesized peptide with SipW-like signal peptide
VAELGVDTCREPRDAHGPCAPNERTETLGPIGLYRGVTGRTRLPRMETRDPRPTRDQRTARRRRRRRALAFLLFMLLLIPSVGTSVLTFALFTDQETVAADFTTGTIVLDAVKIDALVLTTSALMPGDSTTDDVVVENDGTAQLRWAMTSSSTNADAKALRDALTLTVKTVDVTTPGTPCDNFDGSSTLYSGALGASTAAIGDPSPGDQGADRVLNAAANETLCFRVTLPSTAGNAYQGATTTTTFTFDAEQTSSNP